MLKIHLVLWRRAEEILQTKYIRYVKILLKSDVKLSCKYRIKPQKTYNIPDIDTGLKRIKVNIKKNQVILLTSLKQNPLRTIECK